MNVKILENKKQERELSNADHRLIGQQLDLFSINEEVGIGLVLWHPKGTIVRRIIRDFWEEEHLKNGYELVCTPHIARGELWSLATHHKGMGKCKEKCKNNVKITHSSKLLETVMETETIFYIFCNRHP